MLVFPSSPNAGDVFAPGPGFPSWVWDGEKWTRGGAASFALASLSDVSFEYLEQGQVVTWNESERKWVNGAPPAYELGALMDVALAAPVADGQVLAWNAATSRWRNSNELNLASLTLGADPTTAMEAVTKQYVDNKITAIPTPALAGLSDVGLSSPTWGQVLTFNGGTQRWVNGSTVSGPFTINGDNGNYGLFINNQSSSSYGMLVVAGTASGADYCARFFNLDYSRQLLNLRGDGQGSLNGMSFGPAGEFHIDAPAYGALDTLTVVGGAGGYALLALGYGPGAIAAFGRVVFYDYNWNLTFDYRGDGNIYARGVALCFYKPDYSLRQWQVDPTQDEHLYATLDPGVYAFTFLLGFATNGTTGNVPGINFRVDFTGSFFGAAWTGIGVTDAPFTTAYPLNDWNTSLGLWGSSDDKSFGGGTVTLNGSVRVLSTGVLRLMWAQRTSSGYWSMICAGSYLTVTKLS